MAREGKGYGMYRRASDGLWIGWVCVGHRPSGSQILKTCSSKDERVCDAKLLKLRTQLGAGVVIDMSVTVADLLRRYAADRAVVLGKGSSGYKGIVLSTETHIIPRIGTVRLAALKAGAIERMMVGIARDNKTPFTALRAREVVRAAWYWARREGLISGDNPAALAKPSVVDHEQEERRVLTVEQARLILAWPDKVMHAFWAVALATGMRVSEMTALTWEDVDLDAGRAYVPGTKTKASRATVLLAPFAVDALRTHRVVKTGNNITEIRTTGLVWRTESKKPIHRRVVGRRWTRMLDALGIAHVDFHHGTRHTLGELLRGDGVQLQAVQSMLRHALLSTTSRIYAPAQVGEQVVATASVQRLLGD